MSQFEIKVGPAGWTKQQSDASTHVIAEAGTLVAEIEASPVMPTGDAFAYASAGKCKLDSDAVSVVLKRPIVAVDGRTGIREEKFPAGTLCFRVTDMHPPLAQFDQIANGVRTGLFVINPVAP